MTALLAMDKFCNSSFWDSNLSWNTDSPELTICFQKTVLVWLPCLFLWVFSCFDVYFSLTSKTRDIPWNWRNLTKLFIIGMLIAISIFDLLYSFSIKNEFAWVDIFTPIIKVETLMLCGVLSYSHVRHGRRSSGVIFIFWFLFVLLGVPQFQWEIKAVLNGGKDLTHISFIILYLLSCFVFILSFFSDLPPALSEHPEVENQSPEESASFPSYSTFAWFDRLVYLGYKQPLVEGDLWALKYTDRASYIFYYFSKYWNKLLKKEARISKDHTFQANGSTNSPRIDRRRRSLSNSSVLLPLCKIFGLTFFFSSFLLLIQNILSFASPQLLRILIDFVKSDEPEWRGFLYAFLLFIIASLQTVFLAHYDYIMMIIGLRVKTALITAIYRKALRLSNSARKQTTVGEIVNLMSVDALRMMSFVSYLNTLWSSPLQIGLALYFLWDALGASVLAGVGVLVLSLFLNFLIANKEKILSVEEMENKDERIKMMNEILSGIKVLKLYAWEPSFEEEVLKIRNKEVNVLKQMVYLSSATTFLSTCAPFAVSLIVFAVYILSDESHVLDPSRAFMAISLFNLLRGPLYMLPAITVYFTEALVSMRRINSFLNGEEIDPNAISHDENEEDPLIIENGTFSWGDDEEPTLKDINLRIKRGTLVAVVGSVGSGKSSLISSFLGEMEKKAGRVNIQGTIAYVPQLAWIQNATLRDNIIFGNTMRNNYYQDVIEACALKPDLQILPGEDLTEIGEKGINLSGGQKQRVSLARAVYADKDVYFLDDPLSAVDSHVGRHIFENVISSRGILRKKTRIFVTHNISYLPMVDKIVVLKDGTISEVGTYKELLDFKGAFSDFITTYSQEVDGMDIVDLEGSSNKSNIRRQLSTQKSVNSDTSTVSLNNSRGSIVSLISKENVSKINRLIEEEKAQLGGVNWKVYKYYFHSMGFRVAIVTILLFIMYQGFAISTNFWLSMWSNSSSSSMDSKIILWYIAVYGLLGLGQSVSSFLTDIVPRLGCWTAAVKLHKNLLHALLRAPLSFMDTTPVGRIISRFSNDVDRLDGSLQYQICSGIFCFFEALGIIFVISYSTPIFLVVILPVGVIYYILQRFYIPTSRQLKRLESITRSPIFSHFSESVSGCLTIRAYNAQERFITESEEKLDINNVCSYPRLVSQRWLAIRLEMIGNLIIFFSALFAVLGKNSLSPGIVGLSVSYSLEITVILDWLVRMTAEIETNIVSVERIKEYVESPQEAPWEVTPNPIHKDWPEEGHVTFSEYKVRYREGLDLVLKGISCNINSGEKIGIVGRTGAGKSSLTLSLFRLIEAAEGKILIDDVDISKLGLHSLRSRLTIIPQDPVIFSGSLRLNLDPLKQYSDEQIWQTLELAHLKSFVSGLNAGLQFELSEEGENLSVGQRQLICLARALLRKTKILILDEATAAVDLETDDLIQKTIRKEFKDCTVLTIAHRLNTIMDSDRVLVLDKGIIVEYDSPYELLKNENSIFYGMAHDAGLI